MVMEKKAVYHFLTSLSSKKQIIQSEFLGGGKLWVAQAPADVLKTSNTAQNEQKHCVQPCRYSLYVKGAHFEACQGLFHVPVWDNVYI